MREDEATGLIELIDRAALDDAAWRDVLRGVAGALGSSNASLVRHDSASGRAEAIEAGLDPSARDLFVGYYSARNLLRHHSEIDDAFGRRAVTVRPQVRDVLHRSEYYNDFLVPFGIAHLAWVFLDREGSDVTMLTVGRPERREPYDVTELGQLTALMPHLMRSYRIARRLGGLAAPGQTLERYLDLLPHGVLLLDALGRIMHANRAAEAMAAAADGFALTREGPAAASPAAHRRLQAAIAHAADHRQKPRHASSLALPRPSGARPYAAAVCPFGEGAAPLLFGRPSVLLEIRDLASDSVPSESWLADCLDLTAAEARVAALLLCGLDRDAIARRLGVSGDTVRVHLTRLLAKTDTHRQAQLVQVLADVASLQRPPPGTKQVPTGQ